jgi:hypothetical protein
VVSDGVLYEKGDLHDSVYNLMGGNVYRRDIYETGRNSFRLLYRWVIRDLLVLDGVGFFQNSLSDGKDYILRTNQRVSLRLQKWLSLTLSLTYNKITRTQRENSIFSFGITIDKGF